MKTRIPCFFLILPVLLLASCGILHPRSPYTVDYSSFSRKIPMPHLSKSIRDKFNSKREGEFVTIKKQDGTEVSGYVTDNRAFMEKVMIPTLEPHLYTLKQMDPVERINTLTLFGHEIYRTFIGRDYFSWGGDLSDLDDPQEKGPNYKKRYGFDCSGFASMPYTLAVELDLLDPEEEAAVFSPQGFEHYSRKHGIEDKGGRGGTSNRYRVDTADMKNLGREIFRVPKEGEALPEDLAKLQAGDIVLLPEGHAGIVVEIEGAFYYLEAGGWVCPPNGGLPFEIAEALRIFAKKGELVIKRSLPDRK